MSSQIFKQLLALESIFYRSENDGIKREDFERMMATDFWEVGASGEIYQRDFVIKVLLERYSASNDIENDVWQVKDFAVRKIVDNVYLATYQLSQGQEKRLTRRATLWKKVADQWVMQYHQATLISESQIDQ